MTLEKNAQSAFAKMVAKDSTATMSSVTLEAKTEMVVLDHSEMCNRKAGSKPPHLSYLCRTCH